MGQMPFLELVNLTRHIQHSALSPRMGSCKLRVGKKRVPQREKMGFVTRRQDTKQSKATDILALFLYLKSFSGLLITIRMNS